MAEEEHPTVIPERCGDLDNPCTDPECALYFNCNITKTYAGVSITYEVASGMLKFSSINDVNTVLNQLDADYDTYNDNYDNQYPNYTAEQLDSIDVINSFDEFKKFRNFENLFPGYVSKRSQIETTESTWLSNNFTGTDPDTIDLTFDDVENTIFNSSYSFKVGNDVYELKDDGIYLNGVFQEANSRTSTICKSNKKRSEFAVYGSERYKLKVAMNSWIISSGAKGKVVHYKVVNGNWKRRRAKMAVFCGGNIYQALCTFNFTFSNRNPSPSGFKKRKQLKIAYRQAGSVWKTYSGELSSAFETPNQSISAVLPLTF